jgi:hypothetical protein
LVPGTWVFGSWVQRTFASSSSHCPFCALVQSTRNLTSFKPYSCFCTSWIPINAPN